MSDKKPKDTTTLTFRCSDDDMEALDEIGRHMMNTFPGLWPSKTQAIKWAIWRTKEAIEATEGKS